MQIVVAYNDNYLILHGIAATLTSLQQYQINKKHIKTSLWFPSQKPVYDMLDELHPDLLIISAPLITPTIKRAINEYKIPVIILGFGCIDIPTTLLICVPDTTPQKIIDSIKQQTPDIPYYSLKQAANSVQFHVNKIQQIKPKILTDCSSDIFYLSVIQSQDTLQTLAALLQYNNKHNYLYNEKNAHQIKFAGPTHLPFPEYIGIPNLIETLALLHSSKIVLDFNNTIIFDCAINKTFCLSNKENDLFPHYNTQEEFLEQIKHFINNEKHRQSYIKKAHKHILQNGDTYYHRLIDICEKLPKQDPWMTLTKLLKDELNPSPEINI